MNRIEEVKKCVRCGAIRDDGVDSNICGSCADDLRMEEETDERISDTGRD